MHCLVCLGKDNDCCCFSKLVCDHKWVRVVDNQPKVECGKCKTIQVISRERPEFVEPENEEAFWVYVE